MVALASVPTGRFSTSAAHPSIRSTAGPALRHVAPAAAATALLTRPATNTDRARSNLIDYADRVSWEHADDDGLSQYSEATSAVDELRALTGNLFAQLEELDKAGTALDISATAAASTASSADKQTRKAKREEQRASRKPSTSASAASSSAKRSSGTSASAAESSALLYPKARAPRSSSLRTAAVQQQQQQQQPLLPAGATDRDFLEKSWGLPNVDPEQDFLQQDAANDGVDEDDAAEKEDDDENGAWSETALALRRGSHAGSSVSHADSDDEEEGAPLNSVRARLRTPGSSTGRRASPALPASILPSISRADGEDESVGGETVVSSWSRARSSRRANNHGRAAMLAAVATSTASVAKSRASAVVREKRGSTTNPLSMFMKSAIGPLLTLAEEQALMERVEDWRFLMDARKQLVAALKREPTVEEWAMTVMSTPESVKTRLSIGNSARERMVKSNYRLVISIAKRFVRSGRDFPDLIAVGVTGLYKACDKFEVSKGFRFSTYATWWIRQAVMRNLTDQGRVLRLPSHIVEQVAKMRALQVSLIRTLGRPPTEKDLAEAMKLSVAKISHLMSLVAEATSLDLPVGDSDEGDMIKDGIEDERPDAGEHLEDESLSGDLMRMLDCLDEREAGIIRMRYGLDTAGEVATLDVVGRTFDITRERVRQIETKAIRKLREQAKMGNSIVLEYANNHGPVEWAARNSRGTQKT